MLNHWSFPIDDFNLLENNRDNTRKSNPLCEITALDILPKGLLFIDSLAIISVDDWAGSSLLQGQNVLSQMSPASRRFSSDIISQLSRARNYKFHRAHIFVTYLSRISRNPEHCDSIKRILLLLYINFYIGKSIAVYSKVGYSWPILLHLAAQYLWLLKRNNNCHVSTATFQYSCTSRLQYKCW